MTVVVCFNLSVDRLSDSTLCFACLPVYVCIRVYMCVYVYTCVRACALLPVLTVGIFGGCSEYEVGVNVVALLWYLSTGICLIVCLSVFPSVCLSVCLSVSLVTCLLASLCI